MHRATFAICFLLASYCQAQINSILGAKNFRWRTWEVNKYDSAYFQTFLESMAASAQGFNSEEDFKVIRIDSDSLPDIIRINPGGSPGTEIWINDAGTASKIFDSPEKLVYINKSRPWYPLTINTLVEGDEENLFKVYEPKYAAQKLSYEIHSVFLLHPQLEIQKENLPPVEVEFTNVPELHWSPDAQESNLIKTYSIGQRGFAVASTQARFEYNWWLVIIPEGQNTYRIGWMRKAYLKRIR